jgi:hypothetical protein
MFDYQAGEKYKMTLIMVGFAGLMAGMLFTMLFMPQNAEPPKRAARPAWMNDPDTNGGRGVGHHLPGRHGGPRGSDDGSGREAAAGQQMPAAQQIAAAQMTDPQAAATLLNEWLPSAWDLNAGSAAQSQEKAIMYMTPECATAYRQNIWNPDMQKRVQESGLQTTFTVSKLLPGQPQNDGSVVILVEGTQVLTVPGKGSKEQQIKYEYLVKQTSEGLRIAGISDGGASS